MGKQDSNSKPCNSWREMLFPPTCEARSDSHWGVSVLKMLWRSSVSAAEIEVPPCSSTARTTLPIWGCESLIQTPGGSPDCPTEARRPRPRTRPASVGPADDATLREAVLFGLEPGELRFGPPVV